MFTHFLKPILVSVVIVLPAWIIFRVLMRAGQGSNKKPVKWIDELVLTLFIIYTGTVLAVTIVPAPIFNFNNPRVYGLNFIPVVNTYNYFISTLSETDSFGTYSALENIIGNLVLFIPLGIFLPWFSASFNSLKKTITICFLCSLSIELIQLILRQFGTYRTVDIDDVILNTLGGILGWLIFTKLITRYNKAP